MDTLYPGGAGPYVEMVQLALRRAGYYSGALSGSYDENTRTAAQSFQLDFGLAADGITGKRTWLALKPFLTGYGRYRIAAGDSFLSISQRYRTPLHSVITANPGMDPRNLPVGQIITVPYGFDVVPTDISYTYALLEYIIEGLAARYPFLGRGSIGRSVMGRELHMLSIGSGPRQVAYSAAHHANEWITTPVLLKFVEEYAAAYSADGKVLQASAGSMFGAATLYVIPMVNPDGVDLVTGALNGVCGKYTRAKAMAERYPQYPFPSGWKANINGVDLNLSYPAGWEKARDVKFGQGFTMPGPRDYVGEAPLSQSESRAMYDFTRSHDLSLILAYHSQGEVIYWKYADYLPPRSYEIAAEMGRVSGYEVELTPAESGNAGYKDWFIQEYNRPGYTVEVGYGENPLPLSQFDRIYAENRGIMTLGITEAI